MKLMDMGFMIWRVMFGSGVMTGMMKTTIKTHQLRTHQGRTSDHSGCCGVVIGATVLTTCVWLSAAATFRMMGSTATGFDVCQDRINYSCTRAKHGPLQAAKPLPLPLVNQPQTLFASVAEPSGNASRLIASLWSPRWTWRKRSGVPEASTL